VRYKSRVNPDELNRRVAFYIWVFVAMLVIGGLATMAMVLFAPKEVGRVGFALIFVFCGAMSALISRHIRALNRRRIETDPHP